MISELFIGFPSSEPIDLLMRAYRAWFKYKGGQFSFCSVDKYFYESYLFL